MVRTRKRWADLSRGVLLEKFLSLVHLGRQVWTSSSIGMVQQHQGTMSFSDFFLGQRPLTFPSVSMDIQAKAAIRRTYFRDRISDASRLFIRGSNPPL
jgi:hypothetical protein